MTQHGLGGDEPQADVGGDDPASEGVAAQRVLGRWSPGRQAYVDFSVFDRKYLVESSTTTLSMLDREQVILISLGLMEKIYCKMKHLNRLFCCH